MGAAALNGLVRRVFFCLAVLLWSASPGFPPFSAVGAASAAVPVKFTYQGNIRQNGFLVNGTREMVFRVYDSSESVVPLWTSAASDVTVSTGVFQVVLDPVIADWDDGNLWLELEIEGNTLSPREELTSAPYAINSLMLSGKRYTTSASPPAASVDGELWYDTGLKVVNFWNGTDWVPTSGSGLPGAHASTHAGDGADPITALGTHTVSGYMTVSSAVSAGWFIGDGSGLYNLNASAITIGSLSGDRIGNVIVSTHIVDGTITGQDIADDTITRAKLNQSGCANGDILQLSGTQWVCGSGASAGLEVDPLSIHDQDTLQAGATFYVSSGTANDFNVNNSLTVEGTALIKGAPGKQGLSVEATGNVGVGIAGASARLEIHAEDSQAYSLAVGTGTVHQVVVSTSGAVGIGTESPQARMEVTGGENPGEYIMILNSGSKIAAWLRNK
ncbi:MAG TPA: hypothetical protein DDW67_09150 [Elusimicrobia bacterium]|nr:hypothetical protein [Elusimicrobiota bacterium]